MIPCPHPSWILAEAPSQLSARGNGDLLAAVPTHLLGESGCTLKTTLPLGTERIAVLTLELDGSLVSVPAKILEEHRQSGMILTEFEFLEIDPVSTKLLRRFIRRRLDGDQFRNR